MNTDLKFFGFWAIAVFCINSFYVNTLAYLHNYHNYKEMYNSLTLYICYNLYIKGVCRRSENPTGAAKGREGSPSSKRCSSSDNQWDPQGSPKWGDPQLSHWRVQACCLFYLRNFLSIGLMNELFKSNKVPLLQISNL